MTKIALTYPNQSGIVSSVVNNKKVGSDILQEIKTQFNVSAWDDLRIPLTRDKQGQASKPDFDFTNMGLLFPNNDPTEIVYIISQFPHTRKNGTDIHPHIHWIQSQEAFPTWKMEYRWYSNGDAAPTDWTLLSSNTGGFTYPGSGSIAQTSIFGEIDGEDFITVSSLFEVKLYRDDADVAGDILAKEFDIHFEIDNKGSSSEFVK